MVIETPMKSSLVNAYREILFFLAGADAITRQLWDVNYQLEKVIIKRAELLAEMTIWQENLNKMKAEQDCKIRKAKRKEKWRKIFGYLTSLFRFLDSEYRLRASIKDGDVVVEQVIKKGELQKLFYREDTPDVGLRANWIAYKVGDERERIIFGKGDYPEREFVTNAQGLGVTAQNAEDDFFERNRRLRRGKIRIRRIAKK